MNHRNHRHRNTLAAGVIVAVIAVPLALVIAPPDAVQGQAQRLMYLHVPSAWSAYLCFTLVLLASLWHLIRRTGASRRVARAAAEIGVGLTALTLATGSLWGALTWGTWWAWDARVISTVAMGLVYVVYLSVEGLTPGEQGSRVPAAIGVAGFLTVPVVHFSVLWFRTLHQPPTILAPSVDPPIDPLMLLALATTTLAFTLLTVWAVDTRATALAPEPDRAPEREPAVRAEALR
ncbi:cytochrome c biogenesis protein CcsA [Citricoccus sp. GCM10030269]|uniref:cytochrome c biogenesis protein CcsA n=1 Tax=Citricoccus sp. GCM10030269 TaxID=3273388 RepID=UPI00361830BD